VANSIISEIIWVACFRAIPHLFVDPLQVPFRTSGQLFSNARVA
jgi:hypothetical protein